MPRAKKTAVDKVAAPVALKLLQNEVIVTSRPTGLMVHFSPAMKIKLAKVHKGKWDISYDRARNAIVLTAFTGEGKKPMVRTSSGKYDPGKYVIATTRPKSDPPPVFRPIKAPIVFGHKNAVIQIPDDLPARLAQEATPQKKLVRPVLSIVSVEHQFGMHKFEIPFEEFLNVLLPEWSRRGYAIKA